MKRIISLLIAILLSIACMPVVNAFSGYEAALYDPADGDILDSGTLTETVMWSLDEKGLLTISGGGFININDRNSSPFRGSVVIKDVIFEEGITGAATWLFDGCYTLETITLPSTFTENVNMFFSNMTDQYYSLSSVIIAGGNSALSFVYPFVMSADGTVLIKCLPAAQGDITVPDGVTTIDFSAFSGCGRITSLNIPSTVTDMSHFSTPGCDMLDAFYVNGSNSSYSSIDGVLYDRDANTLICYPNNRGPQYSVPDSVTSIDGVNFMYCSSIEAFSVSSGNAAFSSVDGVLFSKNGEDLIAFPQNRSGQYTIPEGVKNIRGYAFSFNDGLTSVIMPDSVETIGMYAFMNCDALESVDMSDGVTTVGKYSFSGCRKLRQIDIPEGCSFIHIYTFEGCTDLNLIRFLNRDIEIYKYDGYDFPDALRIGGYSGSTAQSFADENGLEFCAIEDDSDPSIDPIQTETGSLTDSISWTLDGNGVLTISGTGKIDDSVYVYEFANDPRIRSIVISEGITKLSGYGSLCYGCPNLTSISIPATLTDMQMLINNMNSQPNLDTVIIHPNNKYYSFDDGILYNKNRTKAIRCLNSKTGDVIIPSTVREIGYTTFTFCTGITSVSIPEGVTSLSLGAFNVCENLKTLILPSTLTNIDGGVSSSPKLENMEFPSGSSYFCFEDGMLFNKRKTTLITCLPIVRGDIVLPSGVTSVDYSAFSGCPDITSIAFPEGMNTIDFSWLNYCTGIKSIYVPSTVSRIESAYINQLKNFDSIIVSPDNASFSASDGILFNKSKTKVIRCLPGVNGEVLLPEGVVEFGNNAFYNCPYITKLTIPSTVKTIGSENFISCQNLILDFSDNEALLQNGMYIADGGTNLVYCSKDLSGSITVPSTVTSMYGEAFSGCSLITDITFPAGFDFNNLWSFNVQGCDMLSSFIVQDGNSTCTVIDGVIYDRSVTRLIAYPTHKGPVYSIPDSVTEIDWMKFTGCNNLEEFAVSDNNNYFKAVDGVLFTKEDNALYLCPPQKKGEYTVPDGVTKICVRAFSYLDGITSITMPDSVTELGYKTFYSNKSVSSVRLSAGLTVLPQETFREAVGLESIIVPESVTVVKNEVFMGCENLATVSLPQTLVDLYYSAFRGCVSLKSIDIPANIKDIEAYTFKDCTSLSSISIPGGVTYIEYNAFENCTSLASVAIPEMCNSIGKNSFANCTSLHDVTILDPEAVIEDSAFSGISPDAVFKGISGSTAETYATEHGYRFVELRYYTVSYDLGYDAEAPASQQKECLTDLVLDNTVPVREGFIFRGWTTDPASADPEYMPGGTYSVDEDVTLYAVWQKETVCEGHVDENGDDICDLCGQTLYSVSTVSVLNKSGSSVSPVSGGGKYSEGDLVTVSASAVEGYSFMGWYDKINDSVYSGEALSTDLTYTFMMGRTQRNLAAVYSSNGNAFVNVSGNTFVMTGSSSIQEGSARRSYPIGTSVTVRYTGDNFCQWKNGAGKIVSTSPEYMFTVLSEISLTAVTSSDAADSALVEFVSYYGQIISAFRYTVEDTIDFPVGPSKSGTLFKSWDMTQEEIREAMGTQNLIMVKPVYFDPERIYTVTVTYPEGTESEEYHIEAGDALTLTAKSIDGMVFSYWMDTQKGTILGYNRSYYLMATSDRSITAVYGENITSTPQVVITNTWAFIDDGTEKMSIEVTYNIPEGYTLQQAGLVRSTTVSGEDLVLDGTGVKVHVSSLTAPFGVYTQTLRIGAATDVTVYAKGFVTVINESTGNNETVYSDEIAVSYDELGGSDQQEDDL